MRYLLLMWGHPDSGQAPAPEPGTGPAEPCWMPWAREMDELGVRLGDGGQVQLTALPVTVRADCDEALVADGPFAETKEQMAGYQIIDCAGRDEAILAAARHPVARRGGIVEVRELLAG